MHWDSGLDKGMLHIAYSTGRIYKQIYCDVCSRVVALFSCVVNNIIQLFYETGSLEKAQQ